MFLTAHIDESISKDQRIFNLTTLVAQDSDWVCLASDWLEMISSENRRLNAVGRMPIQRYHATECNARKGNFGDWSPDEQKQFTRRILDLLKRYSTQTLSYSIDLFALAAVIPDRDVIKCAYKISTPLLIHALGRWLHEKRASEDTRVKVIYERCDYDSVINSCFDELVADPAFKYGHFFTTCARDGWQNCTPLQIADLIAYENMKDSERRLDARDTRYTFNAFLKEGDIGIRNFFVDSKSMASMRSFIQSIDPL